MYIQWFQHFGEFICILENWISYQLYRPYIFASVSDWQHNKNLADADTYFEEKMSMEEVLHVCIQSCTLNKSLYLWKEVYATL